MLAASRILVEGQNAVVDPSAAIAAVGPSAAEQVTDRGKSVVMGWIATSGRQDR
jgi:hypothetical protein